MFCSPKQSYYEWNGYFSVGNTVFDYYDNEKEAFKTISENFKNVIAVFDRKTSKITILNDASKDFVGSVKITDGEQESTLNAYVMAHSRHEIQVKGPIRNSFISLELLQGSKAIFKDKIYMKN